MDLWGGVVSLSLSKTNPSFKFLFSYNNNQSNKTVWWGEGVLVLEWDPRGGSEVVVDRRWW